MRIAMQRVWKFDTFFHRLGAPVEDALPRGQKTGRPIVLDDHTRTTLDVHFISSLPVRQQPVCKAWADTKPARSIWDVS